MAPKTLGYRDYFHFNRGFNLGELMHTEVRRTKNVEIKVTNAENGTEDCGITGFVSHEGYCARPHG